MTSPEGFLAARDRVFRNLFKEHQPTWPRVPTEDVVWGLVRMVLAQQVSTSVAVARAARVLQIAPEFSRGQVDPGTAPDDVFRRSGATGRQAMCCAMILRERDRIREYSRFSDPDTHVLGIPGVGPWTIACFRILVLRHEDVLPSGDVGLERAFHRQYGERASLERRSRIWRPFRSVAVWHLWRSLGNTPLG